MKRTTVVAAAAFVATALTAAPALGAGPAEDGCFDRETRPYTSVVDSHLHFRPFGGPAIPFEEVTGYLSRTGVRYANIYGIGQTLPVDSDCTYYLDCPGTKVTPSMKNDFANARALLDHQPDDVELALSMTFPDLANPDGILDRMRLLDEEYPGRFRWTGEVNLIKQALLNNAHEPATRADIRAWAPFMAELRERDIPLTIHSDLGNDADPEEFLPLMEEVLRAYPENRVVWAHMGMSKELSTMDPARHIAILDRLMRQHPQLYLDISWRVLDDLYFSKPAARKQYVDFFNEVSERVIPGTDFVASRDKDFDVYKEELDVTSRINQYLDDDAFRDIALGQSYFGLLGLDATAPAVCDV